jgi:hypothetical protein
LQEAGLAKPIAASRPPYINEEHKGGAPMITAIVLYDLPPSIGLEECREHFTKIAPDFLKAKGFVRKQFICRKEGGVAGGVYMWDLPEFRRHAAQQIW